MKRGDDDGKHGAPGETADLFAEFAAAADAADVAAAEMAASVGLTVVPEVPREAPADEHSSTQAQAPLEDSGPAPARPELTDASAGAPGARVLSFTDHQLRQLRERHATLSQRMHELVALARENEQLSSHLHRLGIALLGADGLDEVTGRVYTTLREDVGVELAVIALYARPKRASDQGLDELRAEDDPVRARFAHVFERNLPVCGPLSPAAARELVGLRGPEFSSAALVPIGQRPFGLLALLSRDPERYHASMGKVFLRRVGELLAVSLEAHLELSGG